MPTLVAPTPVAPTSTRRPLAITTDADLLDDLLRLAAAGGVDLEVAHDPVAARQRYVPAPLVLIGIDAARACERAGLPRRPDVALVARACDPPAWDLAELLGAERVAVLPNAEPWLVDRFADLASLTGSPGYVLAVVSGRGGGGASVLSVGLAVTGMRAGLRTLLIDGDPLGGGIDLVLGWEQVNGLRWPALRETTGRVFAPALVEALPGRGELVVLSWDRGELMAVPPAAMAAALEAGQCGRDLVVVDVPRRLDEAAVLALKSADRALLVVPAEVRATFAARKVAAAVLPYCPSLSLVVRGPSPGRLTPDDVAESLDLPLVGELRPERELAKALEHGRIPAGRGRGPLASLCRQILGDVIAARRAAA